MKDEVEKILEAYGAHIAGADLGELLTKDEATTTLLDLIGKENEKVAIEVARRYEKRVEVQVAKAQVEAVRAARIDELEHIERESVDKLIWWDIHLPENISIRDRLANLTKEDKKPE